MPACGGDDGGGGGDASLASPDARPLCYGGGGTPTPGAEIELGTGQSEFVSLATDDEVPVYAGGQGGYHVLGHARIRGLSPGDREQPAEANPATWFSVYREDGTLINLQECTYPQAYQEGPDGTYELPYGRIVQILSRHVPEVYGERVRIVAEVMDGEGHYATDERWVIAVPVSMPDAGVPDAMPPPMDAGMDAAIAAP